ncbi:acyltransferase domain-containing protein [Paenibacillus sp. NPDC057934]|uniref:acyltransferase domain-containing protein n=1 Tax=Paenibacillus sp. NPDC057934 TaxID=3346282 RepID=UPI0036DA28CC
MSDRRSTVFLYSGQGSQYYRMGEPFYRNNPIFRDCLEKLNHEFVRLTGRSALEELYHPNKKIGEPFKRTLYTHASIFMVEYALTQVLLENDIIPDAVAGSSLGDFVAAVTANVWSWQTALEAIVVQAQLLETHCRLGGMLAVFENHLLFHTSPDLYRNCEIAAVNNDNHFIVAGSQEGLLRVQEYLGQQGIIFVPLPVEYGFHSSDVDSIGNDYQRIIEAYSYRSPSIPWISGLYGKETRVAERDFFWQVIRRPIDVAGTIKELLRLFPRSLFVDLSPSGTFINLMKPFMGEQKPEVISLLSPFHSNTTHLDQLLLR